MRRRIRASSEWQSPPGALREANSSPNTDEGTDPE